MFRIGNPTDPRTDNERFEGREEAQEAAVKASTDGDVWAVWDEKSGEVLALVFCHKVYKA